MQQHDGAADASFVATHEDRLVRSLMSETGLSRAAAANVFAAVAPAGSGRPFPTDGAAYGWLRVAARHLAAGDPAWEAAADTALGGAEIAAAALAGLPAEDRELLRLRYVDGLLPAVVAARLGLTVADVLARLDRARAAAARSLPGAPRRTPAVSLPRAAAALAAAAAAVALFGGGGLGPITPPAAAAPLPSYADLSGSDTPAGEPVPAADRTRVLTVLGGLLGVDGDVLRPPVGDYEPPSGCDRCGGRTLVDTLHVAVPDPVAPVVGDDEITVEQGAGHEQVKFCDTIPAAAPGVRCVRTEH